MESKEIRQNRETDLYNEGYKERYDSSVEEKTRERDDYDGYRCSWEETGLTQDNLTYMEQWLQSNPVYLEKIKKRKQLRKERQTGLEKKVSPATVEVYELLYKTGFLRESWLVSHDSPNAVLRLATK